MTTFIQNGLNPEISCNLCLMKMKKPMPEQSLGFIIDNFSPFQKNKNVVYTFRLYGRPYCIRSINEFEWGQPDFPEKDIEDNYTTYLIYNTYEEARNYVDNMKKLEGSKI